MNRVEERAGSMGEEEGFIPRQNLPEYVSNKFSKRILKIPFVKGFPFVENSPFV
jgi:hypothetical protein